jgi:NADPH-dependent glutamate synthase beta subunit-like oxidoreductase
MLHSGIPAYRLPRAELMSEIARIEAMGVRIVTGHAVTDVRAEQAAGGFDAVLIAIGAQIERRVEIPAIDASRVINALELLRAIDRDEPPRIGRRVVVYGGGNTAIDAARSARRLGAAEPLIIYRRDRAHMGAHDVELREALDEGVTVRWLSTIRSIGAGDLLVERMVLDEQGFPQPTGEIERLEADSVVLALGEQADTSFLSGTPGIEVAPDGSILVGADLMTGADGIFAGGDATPGSRSVTTATGHGKRAARAIDAWLAGVQRPAKPQRAPIGFVDLHLPIFTDALARVETALAPAARLGGFGEVVASLDAGAARFEAQRCLSCGNCYECDQCFAACPEHAIVKLRPGERYRLDTNRCTGCRACFEQCPCHAIEMIAEPV